MVYSLYVHYFAAKVVKNAGNKRVFKKKAQK